MQGYIMGSVGPSLKVHYNGDVEASMQGYDKGSDDSCISVHYNG
jgi:hypothetical protein